MMSAPKVAVLFGFGINCDHETAAVFNLVGGDSERVHVNHFISGQRSLEEFQILAVPGGFSFGDHLGSGRLMGNRMRFALREQLQAFVAAGKPIIGICNGFQVLVKTGLLPGPNAQLPDFVQRASLTLNDSGRYEDRWVTLEFDAGRRQKIRPGDVLGVLTGDAGLAGRQVGKINIQDNASYVAIERDALRQAMSYLKNGKLKGRSVRARRLKLS